MWGTVVAVQQDFSFSKFEDGVLTVVMTPATAIGGRSIQFEVSHRIGGSTSGMPIKSVASGYNNVSGINITNSGAGQFNVIINSADTSGLDYGNYAYQVTRLDSGNRTVISEGVFTVGPTTY